jgi:phosphoribosyl-ATP pyrophosphohydrolase
LNFCSSSTAKASLTTRPRFKSTHAYCRRDHDGETTASQCARSGLAAASDTLIKRELAARHADDADAYYAVKDPVCDLIMAAAEPWALGAGWRLPPSDARGVSDSEKSSHRERFSWTFGAELRHKNMSVTGLIRSSPMLKAKITENLGAANANGQDRMARLASAIAEVRSGGRLSPRTAKLLASDIAKMAKKVVEEAAETAIDAVRGDRAAVVNESVDLLYNLSIVWSEMGIDPDEIWTEMDRRERVLGMVEKLPKIKSEDDGLKAIEPDMAELGED